jgi:hypothetical protein
MTRNNSVPISILLLLLIYPIGLSRQAQQARMPPPSKQPATASVTFAEVSAIESGITWVHTNAKSEHRYLPETVSPGGCFFDFDNDGWMDIYLVNSGKSDFYIPQKPLKNALYRNNGDGTFSDVTERAGVIGGTEFGMGAAAGDYDGDGWTDLYVTNYGRNHLFRNNGNGTFTDVSERAGVTAQGWSTCAVWFDYDADGKLDLFVSSFVSYKKSEQIFCGDNVLKRRYYCVPRVFKPTPSRLFRNNGDGTFRDVSKESGIADSLGKAFGVVATDINNDGFQDLFVANDTVANFLFLNNGKGKFEEIGLPSGVAYSEGGVPRSGMGVDATDFDGDGWQDLFVANIDQELFSLYQNGKDLSFTDESGEIAPATRLLSGWGLKFFDYDNDGDPDLFLANGHPDDMIEQQISNVRYKEPLLMFENVNGKYRNVSSRSGAVFTRDYPARGLTVGDYDNDGDLDLLVINNGEPPLLLKNEGGNQNNWVGLQLVATRSNPAASGAIITWHSNGKTHRRYKTTGGSYLASHDPREILGIGASGKVDFIEIKWMNGKIDRILNPPDQ